METFLWACLVFVFVATFLLSLLHISLSSYSKISFSRFLEKKDKKQRAQLLDLYDDMDEAAGFLRNVFLLAFIIFLFLLFPRARFWPLGIFLLLVATYILFFDWLPRGVNILTRNRAIGIFLPAFRLLRVLATPLFIFSKEKPGLEKEAERETTEEEIETFIDEAREEGLIEKGEARLLRGVVEFGDIIVKEIMTPRVDMVCIQEDAPVEKLLELVQAEKVSRIPVYKDRIDNIEGIIHVKDLLTCQKKEGETPALRDFIRPVHFVPETMKVAKLLRELQKQKGKMAIVVDEHGGVSGLVTMEDLIEEIVGEIQDEYDQEEPQVVPLGPNEYAISGEVSVRKVEDLFDRDLAEEDYITIGGFITHHLGRLPRKGEALSLKGLRVEVLAVDQKKILKLRVAREGEPPEEKS